MPKLKRRHPSHYDASEIRHQSADDDVALPPVVGIGPECFQRLLELEKHVTMCEGSLRQFHSKLEQKFLADEGTTGEKSAWYGEKTA